MKRNIDTTKKNSIKVCVLVVIKERRNLFLGKRRRKRKTFHKMKLLQQTINIWKAYTI